MGRTSDFIKNFNWTIAIGVLFGLISLFLLIDTSMTIAFLTNSGSITSDSLKAASITFLLFSIGGISLSIAGLVIFVKYNNKVLDTTTPVVGHAVEMQPINTTQSNVSQGNMLFT
jgi:hypothetical protein